MLSTPCKQSTVPSPTSQCSFIDTLSPLAINCLQGWGTSRRLVGAVLLQQQRTPTTSSSFFTNCSFLACPSLPAALLNWPCSPSIQSSPSSALKMSQLPSQVGSMVRMVAGGQQTDPAAIQAKVRRSWCPPLARFLSFQPCVFFFFLN